MVQLEAHLAILLLSMATLSCTLGCFLVGRLSTILDDQGSGGITGMLMRQQYRLDDPLTNSSSLRRSPLPEDAPTGTGVFILGMHRSGTSMLAGLLVEGMGYNAGEPLKPAFKFNKKGYFELQPLIDQNVKWIEDQVIDVINSPYSFDATKKMRFNQDGAAVLDLLKRRSTVPYMIKSPTVCLTLPLWLAELKVKPAVVFTFRHPMDVAYSLERRERHPIRFGMRAWIAYYKRAVEGSQGLCRVVTSYVRVLDNPLEEVSRISRELTEKCGVALPPKSLSMEAVAEFADPSLNHALTAPTNETVLEEYTKDCTIYNHPRILHPHLDLWHRVSRIFCDLQSEKVFEEGYDWHIGLEKDVDF